MYFSSSSLLSSTCSFVERFISFSIFSDLLFVFPYSCALELLLGHYLQNCFWVIRDVPVALDLRRVFLIFKTLVNRFS